MTPLMRAALASNLDEDQAEAVNVDSTLVLQFTPASNRAPTGLFALLVPAQACERIWEELEALHKNTFG